MTVITEYQNKMYCDVATQAKGTAGKDILLCIFSENGEKLLAIAGQQSLAINREKEIIEINSKTIDGGWKTKVPGIKDWSIEVDGMYSFSDETHKQLSKAFENDEYVCCKVVNAKTKKPLFGGLALLKELNLEAPYDDTVMFDTTLEGCGKLVDLTGDLASTATAMPGEGA